MSAIVHVDALEARGVVPVLTTVPKHMREGRLARLAPRATRRTPARAARTELFAAQATALSAGMGLTSPADVTSRSSTFAGRSIRSSTTAVEGDGVHPLRAPEGGGWGARRVGARVRVRRPEPRDPSRARARGGRGDGRRVVTGGVAVHIARWDLDKTYLRTEFDTLRDLVKTALERPDQKRTNPGASTLLREMVRAGVRVHILSGSPEQMRRRLEDKLRLDGITWDSFTLKPNLKNVLRLRFRAVKDQARLQAPGAPLGPRAPRRLRRAHDRHDRDARSSATTRRRTPSSTRSTATSWPAASTRTSSSQSSRGAARLRGRRRRGRRDLPHRRARRGRRSNPHPPRSADAPRRLPRVRRPRRSVLQLPPGRLRAPGRRAPARRGRPAGRRGARHRAPLRRRRPRAELPRPRAARAPAGRGRPRADRDARRLAPRRPGPRGGRAEGDGGEAAVDGRARAPAWKGAPQEMPDYLALVESHNRRRGRG